MDYVVGSVAALISGNVTPNRPKILKRALTPMKHQPSPNVTPKSESITDRSIFLSPTMQKKKAIVKKSPKRIFQNPELDATTENDLETSKSSPKADKVKKHLKDELDADMDATRFILSPKSPKNKMQLTSPSKKQMNISTENPIPEKIQVSNESTPKKKKKKINVEIEPTSDHKSTINKCNNNQDNSTTTELETSVESNRLKKKRKSSIFTVESISNSEATAERSTETSKQSGLEQVDKKKNKNKTKPNKARKDISEKSSLEIDKSPSVNKENEIQTKVKKNKKRKKKLTKNSLKSIEKENTTDNHDEAQTVHEGIVDYINPNAITTQDTDSEHESDDEIQSENEESNKAVLDTSPQESSDEEEETKKKPEKPKSESVKENVNTEEEVKRTLFVGNVPFSNKCKKEIKRIFDKYGKIETVRIRTVPVKDGRVTPKLAVIKNELHPDRSTVNVYIKYAHPSSVNDALVENNTVLNEHHLRVARSDVTGSEHDPKCSVFVGNIPFALEDEALRAMFDKCGEIESVRIVRDRKTNAGKGFGYVNFASKDGVELALALTEEDLTLKNRILRVKRCTQLTMNQQGRHRNQDRQQNYQGRQQTQPGRPQNQNRHFNDYRGGYNRENQVNRIGRNQFSNNRFQRNDQSTDGKNDGAYRRIMNKRQNQESSEGPPQKRQRNLDQPGKEKKPRKEFVGMTADKKKFQKRKFNKDQKKKKVLSEILTKRRQ